MRNDHYKRSLFVHRRDHRIDDNTALIEAGRTCDVVFSCFIVDPRQIHQNPYRSESAVQFMHDALVDLDAQYREMGSVLHLYQGVAHDVIASIVRDNDIDAVFVNRDYTPFSVQRDKAIESTCKKLGVAFCAYDDALLHAPGVVVKNDGAPYSIFTPYHKKAQEHPLREPASFSGHAGAMDDPCGVDVLYDWLALERGGFNGMRGGRARAVDILETLDRRHTYAVDRDIPSRDGTTRLSAHLKFGCCSAREVARAIRTELGGDHGLLRQLHWRDFFTQVAYFTPRVFKGPYNERYANIAWENDERKFNAWCKGRTGFPIVDAAMRELEKTGYMHNRARMITASFLTKDLHIDWRWGERHFASRLIDYDPSVNNGNWQWAASTGCDAQPYFRIFNPWLQQKKFDADATYIKTWVPELAAFSPREIHNLWKKRPEDIDYPGPLVDHATRARAAKEMYQIARGADRPNDR